MFLGLRVLFHRMWWLAGACIALLGRGEVFSDYSAFSGLTGIFSVGVPSQELRLSLDFSSDNILLFSESVCPPFVRYCYSMADSDSLARGGMVGGIQDERGFRSVFSGSELVEFNADPAPLPTSLVMEWRPLTTEFTEVAGVLGIGPSSPLFTGKRVRVSRDRLRGKHSVSISAALPQPSALSVAVTSTSETAWSFSGSLVLSEAIGWGADIVLDLSQQELLIPDRRRGELSDRMHPHAYIENDRLMVDCNLWGMPSPELQLSFAIHQGRKRHLVKFAMESLVLPNEMSSFTMRLTSKLRPACPTRVRFHASDTVVLGRPVLESVSSIVLDFARRQIEFGSQPAVASELWSPVPLAPPLVPVFTSPSVLIEGLHRVISLGVDRDADEALVLLNLDPSPLDDGIGWRLIRSGPRGRLDRPDLTFPGGALSVELQLSFSELSFVTYPGQDSSGHRVILRRTAQFVDIIMAQRVSLEMLDMPPAEVVDTAAGECSICLEEMAAGQTVQRLPACSHRFHVVCIRRWLRRLGDPTCPVCRTIVRPAEPAETQLARIVDRSGSCCIN